MRIVAATENDMDLLVSMNRELFEDEKNDAIPTDEVLGQRLREHLGNGACAYLFAEGEETVGYALVNRKAAPEYLMHFMIRRASRRSGMGTEAFRLLTETLGTGRLDLDVFCWNECGRAFWHSLGFRERCIIMRRDVPLSTSSDIICNGVIEEQWVHT